MVEQPRHPDCPDWVAEQNADCTKSMFKGLPQGGEMKYQPDDQPQAAQLRWWLNCNAHVLAPAELNRIWTMIDDAAREEWKGTRVVSAEDPAGFRLVSERERE